MQNILLVDDPEYVSDIVTALHQHRPEWQITVAATGGEAKAMLLANPYDLLLLGQDLVDMPGLALWQALQPETHLVATVFMAREETAVSQALNAGVQS